MKDLNKTVFISLFKEACEKCFGFPLVSPLSDADSKLLSNKILEQTGLVIGAKSIKNYSHYILNNQDAKKENPSNATLDTLARYVLDAPFTNELQRKEKEDYYPYWFQYRSKFTSTKSNGKVVPWNMNIIAVIFYIIVVLAAGFILIRNIKQRNGTGYFTDNFDSLSNDSLSYRGWILKSPDTVWWNRKNEKPGHLAFYTLIGDNWPLGKKNAGIKNLLIREIYSDCFTVEAHLSDFIPKTNWQQAGILLAEDSTFNSRMIRFTILYNDFFGGYAKRPEITLQAVSSSVNGSQSKPEEIIQLPLFNVDPGGDSLLTYNLKTSVLKIEKRDSHFRFLYITSPVESFAYKEAAIVELNIQPKYVGIFAIQGWAEKENIIPVYFDSFVLTKIPCSQ